MSEHVAGPSSSPAEPVPEQLSEGYIELQAAAKSPLSGQGRRARKSFPDGFVTMPGAAARPIAPPAAGFPAEWDAE
jgi:hypothetical protein